MILSLASILADSARRCPNKSAISLGARNVSYADLQKMAEAVAATLIETGIQPGDRVAICIPNTPEFAAAYYGVIIAGAVAVPLSVLLTEKEIDYCCRDSQAQLILSGAASDELARAGAEMAGLTAIRVDILKVSKRCDPVVRRGTDPAVILYTSGTTGAPKGAVLRHENLVMNALLSASRIIGLSEQDVLLGCLPLSHTFGQTCILNAGLFAGAEIVLMERFEPKKALQILAERGVTVMAGVPTMYVAICDEMRQSRPKGLTDMLRLTKALTGGAPTPVDVIHDVERLLGAAVYEGYGLSECAPVVSFNHPNEPVRPGTIGRAIWGVDVELRLENGTRTKAGGPGEIIVRGHNVMLGYHNRPEATAEAISTDGWFRTGDVGTIDREGVITIVDRLKNMILRGGYNVYPREVEEVLYAFPSVLEACVIGVPDRRLGEEVVAYVVAKKECEIDIEALDSHARQGLASYKYPRAYRVVAMLPKGPTGKILKREIISMEMNREARSGPFIEPTT